MPRVDDIRLRRGTLAEWTAANPVLNDGEVGLITDTRTFVVGDGATAFTGLSLWASNDFGATGLKANVIAESTAAAGVTVDGVLLKDADVYPNGDKAGLHTRRISWQQITDDFTAGANGNGLGNGWGSWATAGFTDPITGVNAVNYKSILWCAFPSGAYPVGFLPRSTPPTTFAKCAQYCHVALRSMPNGSYGGLRLDDGTASNSIEILVRQQTAQVEIIKRETVGGVSTVTVLKTITLSPAWIGLHLNASGTWASNWTSGGYVFIDAPAVENLFTSSAYAWQPARIGVTFYINATGITSRAAIFDWYGATI